MNTGKIGRFIYQLRTEKHLSQYQLAEMIPITRQAVSKWERGVTVPDSTTLLRLSEIFDVTINELLNGERIKKESIHQLEEITLNMLDENHKKSKVIKKIIYSFIITVIGLVILFLSYYFINSYNSVKVYTISQSSDHFIIYEGIFITTQEKSYLKIGKIQSIHDENIQNIKLFYQKNKQKLLLEENEDINMTLMDNFGYDEIIKNNKLENMIKNMYIEIQYDDAKKEKIPLKFERIFANNSLIFKKNIIGKESNINSSDMLNIEEEMIIAIIKNQSVSKKDEHYYMNNSTENIMIDYWDKQNTITFTKNGTQKWIYYLAKREYFCYDFTEAKKCKEIIEKDINRYIK